MNSMRSTWIVPSSCDRTGLLAMLRRMVAINVLAFARILGVLAGITIFGAPISAGAITINEYEVPTPRSGNSCIVAGNDGALWFTEYLTNKIGRITTSGAFSEFPVPTANSEPGCITPGQDGALWFTEGTGNKIGRITTFESAITEFALPAPESLPSWITTSADGALWFTENRPSHNAVARITTEGVITIFPTPTGSLLGITAGPDGALWFIDGNKIIRMTTTGVITNEFVLSSPGTGPTSITPGPDGALWFTESELANKIGRITTAGAISEYPIPTANSGPTSIIAGPDGALWFTEFDVNKIGRITTAGVITNEFSVPTANAGPVNIAAADDGTLWFTELLTNKIGRIAGVVPTISEPGGCFKGEKCNTCPQCKYGCGIISEKDTGPVYACFAHPLGSLAK